MKLVRQRILHYREGSSDKVYEVDLCELGPDRYLVNFRYGRRGSHLKEGTKTVGAVSRAEAERIFSELVESKLLKGYRDAAMTPMSAQPAVVVPKVSDQRKQAILNRLAGQPSTGARTGLIDRIMNRTPRRHSPWPLERAIWRAGELKIREAAPILAQLLGTADWMRDYCIAWALGWCGDDSSIEPLARLFNDPKVHEAVRRIACEALLKLSDAQTRLQFQSEMHAKLPAVLQPVAKSGSAEEFKERLTSYLKSASAAEYEVLETIYLIDSPVVRPALLHIAANAPLQENYFQRLRRIFKSAEYRRDAEMFGILAHRFETTRCSHYQPFSKKTQNYFKRRVWRVLRTLAEEGDLDYVKMAVGVLLPYKDADGHKHTVYSWRRGNQAVFGYAEYWAFCNILFKNSTRYECKNYFWRSKGNQTGSSKREEAYPQLWDALPQGLLHLLSESRCKLVNEFAVRALSDNRDFCSRLENDVLKMLIESPYEVVSEFGFEIVRRRYRADNPQPELLLALACSSSAQARQQAQVWIEASQRHLVSNIGFWEGLAASPYSDTRQFARRLLMVLPPSDAVVKPLIGRLIAALLILKSEEAGAEAKAQDMSQTIFSCFAPQLRSVGMGVLLDLVQHPMRAVQELGGQILLNHEVLPEQIDDEILEALINSQFDAVRAYGVRILRQLSEEVLVGRQRLLAVLAFHKQEDVRAAVQPLVWSAVAKDRESCDRFAELCVERLLLETDQGIQRSIAEMLTDTLKGWKDRVNLETVMRLVRAKSIYAREVAGLLLQHRSSDWAARITTQELVRFSRNESHELRVAAQRLFENLSERYHRSSNPDVNNEMATLVKVLDVKWDDSRAYWFQVFRTFFHLEDFTPEVLVSVCDSVRKDVQALGRELITRNFRTEDGAEYLLKLSEHPNADLQSFAASYLEDYAKDHPERILSLKNYFVTVLSMVNRGRVAKLRILRFLEQEALKSQSVAEMVAEILTRQSVTIAIGDRAAAIEAMVRIHKIYPAIALPLTFKSPEVRHAV